MFYRRVQPSEIEKMSYHDLKYWNKWHDAMSKEEKRISDKIKEKNA